MFAFASFIGVLGAFVLGNRTGTWMLVVGGVLMLVGVVLTSLSRTAMTMRLLNTNMPIRMCLTHTTCTRIEVKSTRSM